MQIPLANADFRLNEVVVRPASLVLERAGEQIRVEPRVMEILVFLAERAGEPISRDQLRDELWDAYVTDDAIHRGVWKLRQGLGEHSDLIETVSKRGYRVKARPELLAPEPGPQPTVAVPESYGDPGGLGRYLGIAATAAAVVFFLWLGQRDTPPLAAARDAAADFEFVPFSSMSGYESMPDIDDAGTRVVFANFPKEGDHAFEWDLWERPLSGGPARRLTSTPEHEVSPALSPTGDRVAFVRMTPDTCAFFTLEAATGVDTPIGVDCGVSRGPTDCCARVDWLGQDRLVLGRRESLDAPSRLYLLDLSSGAMQMLTDPPAQSDGDRDFAVSHDRSRLALVRHRTREIADLYVLELDSSSIRRVTTAGYGISGVEWTPDDARLVFGWSRTGTSALWEVAESGGEPRPVHTVGMNASAPAMTSASLVYEEWTSEINLVALDLETGEADRPVASTRWDWRGSVSPNGRRLAFVTNREGGEEIWVADSDGPGTRSSQPYRLTDLEGPFASAPAWSPDNRQLVVSVAGSGGLDLALIDSDSGDLRWLVVDASDEREPIFSAAGREVLFSSNRSGGGDIHSIALDTGEIRRWTNGGGASARPAADGRGIWFVRSGSAGLWRQHSWDTDPELANSGFLPSAESDWSVVGESIYFIRWDEAHTAWLSLLEPSTGTTTDLLRLEENEGVRELYASSGLWVSSDGRRALFSSVDLSHSDLWLRRGRH